MKQSMSEPARVIVLCVAWVCAAVFFWHATSILYGAFVQVLAPVLPLIGLVFVSLMLLYLVIVMILSIIWMIGEVYDRHCYFKARQAYREMQLELYRSQLSRSSRSRHTDADLRSVHPHVFHRRTD